MDDAVIATHLENFSRGFARMEQILPTLATKEEVNKLDRRLERVEQILPTLSTKEEVNKLDRRLERVEQILPTLATKDELRAEHDRLRLDVRILLEHQDSKLQVIAEHVLSLMSKPREQ